MFLWGEPGVGKTAGVRRWAEDRGYQMHTLIGSLLDPTDLSGIPTLGENGRTRFAPPDWFMRIIEDGTAKRWVVFLDELNCSPPSVMASMLRLINERAVHEHHLPEHTLFIAAGNDSNQVEIASDLPASMSSRFAHLEWRPYSGREKMIAQARGWPVPDRIEFTQEEVEKNRSRWRAIIADFQDKNPSAVFDFANNNGALATQGRGYPTGRTWTMTEEALALVDCLPDALDLHSAVGTALLSQSVANELLTYADSLNLPDPEVWLKNPLDVRPLDRDDQNAVAMNAVVQAALLKPSLERWQAAMRVAITLASAGKKTVVVPNVVTLSEKENRPASVDSEVLLAPDIEKGLQEHFLELFAQQSVLQKEFSSVLQKKGKK